MKYYILLLWFLLFSTVKPDYKNDKVLENEISYPDAYIPQPFDVISYYAELNFMSFPSKVMSGKCVIEVKCLGKPDTSVFFFHLRDLKVDSIFWGETPAFFEIIEDESSPIFHYNVPFPENGEIPKLMIYYSGEMTCEESKEFGGVYYSDNILYSIGVGMNNNYVSATQHWLPCYDHPSDKALFSAKFFVPKGLYAASIGELKSTENSGDTSIFYWEHSYPCATYLYTFAVSDYIPLELSSQNPKIIVYSQPKDTANSKFAYKKLPVMVHFLENIFGDYPFEKVGYANTVLGAMEHQTLVSLPISVVNNIALRKDTVASIILHELSHQWFGDLVTCRDFGDAWLNEGFATFCESMWNEYLYGQDRYLTIQSNNISLYLNQIYNSEGALRLHNFSRNASNYPLTIYYKGAIVLAMLRYELGDAWFFPAIKNYLEENKFGNVTTETLKKSFENYTGKDLNWFFEQWIYGFGWPMLYISYNKIMYPDGKYCKVSLNIRQNQPKSYGSYLNLPVELTFYDENYNPIHRLVKMKTHQENYELDSIPQFSLLQVNKGPTVRALLQVMEITSVDENSMAEENKLIIYPNPSNGIIEILSENDFDIDIDLSVNIYNIRGDLVFENVKPDFLDNNRMVLYLGSIPNGTYIIKIKTNANEISRKFVISN